MRELPHPTIVAVGTLPEVVFPLLDQLRVRAAISAARIDDRYSFVLKGVKEDEIKDWEMVAGLVEVITQAFNDHAPSGMFFGRRAMDWGYWPYG